MSLESLGTKLLNSRFWGMAFTAAIAAFLSALIGSKIDGKFPGARFVPPLAFIVAGLALTKGKEEATGYGLAFALGAGADLGVVIVQRTGLLGALGVK